MRENLTGRNVWFFRDLRERMGARGKVLLDVHPKSRVAECDTPGHPENPDEPKYLSQNLKLGVPLHLTNLVQIKAERGGFEPPVRI